MRVSLIKTRKQIRDDNSFFDIKEDFFRIINTVSKRNWNFTISNKESVNTLDITADPKLNDNEKKYILSGIIPSIYSYDEILCKLDDRTYKIMPNKVFALEKELMQKFYYDFENSDDDIISDFTIFNYNSLRYAQNENSLKKVIYKNTWFGNKLYLNNYKIDYNFLFKKYTVKQNISDLDDLDPCITLSSNLDSDLRLKVFLSPKLDTSIIRHQQFGNIDHDYALRQKINKHIYDNTIKYIVEIEDEEYSWYTSQIYDQNYLKKLFIKIENSLKDIFIKESAKEYFEEVSLWKKRIAADQLTDRQNKLNSADFVFLNNTKLFKCPQYETEVVSLYMKLESRGNILPFDCNVLEYTGKKGIDALGNYRMNTVDAYKISAPIEFEHQYENYFEHGHPTEQTSLIICWDICDENLIEQSDCQWYFKDENNIDVVILKNIPNIEIRRD